MSQTSAKDVKNLRDITGAGMMDCKKALDETGGDMQQAIDYLRYILVNLDIFLIIFDILLL